MRQKIKRNLIVLIFLTAMMVAPQTLLAHCQIPCGIYDDAARVEAMLEDVATIDKSVALVIQLADKQGAQNANQLVRWVVNKEKHAQNIIATISDYFLTQRVKPQQKDYGERLARHHAVIIAAMKVKQNAAISYVDDLKKKVEALKSYYPGHSH